MYQGKYERGKETPAVTPEVTPELPQETQPATPNPRRRTASPKKSSPKKGTMIFYGCLIGFVLIFSIGIAIFLSWLNNWLVNFEAAQPDSQAQVVFQQHFAKLNWSKLYETAGEEDTAFEDATTFAAYMNTVVGSQELSYVETASGQDNVYKYSVKAGNDRIASFTLVTDDPGAQVPEWELGSVELIYSRDTFCTILTAPGTTVTVNGVTLDESYQVKTIATLAEDHLPEGVHGYRAVVYRVDQLLVTPKVTVTDANGESLEVTYNADSCAFTHPMGSVEITETEADTLVTAAQMYCKYMIGQVGTTTLKKYIDGNSAIYKTMTSIDKWMQSYKSFTFEEAVITDYYRYSDTLYSARVDMSLLVTRPDNSVKDYPLHSTFLMDKQSDGWKVIDILNMNIQDQTVSVRLTYMDGETQIHTEMVDANALVITLPSVTVPEGMELSGWYDKTTNDLVFEATETGTVNLSGDVPLEPMVLCPYFTAKEA